MFKKNRKTFRGFAAAMAAVMTLSFSAFSTTAVLAAPEFNVDTEAVENYDGEGHLPIGLDRDYYRYLPLERAANTAIPEQYDIRDNNWIGSVRNQDPYGSCWSFGTTASIESNAIKNGAGEADEIDYSEFFQAWFGYRLYQGEGLKVVKIPETDEGVFEDDILNFGGKREITATDTASWKGPVDEALLPYPSHTFSIPSDTLLDQVPEADTVHVQNIDFLPETGLIEKDENGKEISYTFDENAKVEIQKALMNNGALDVSYYAGRNLPDESEDTDIFDLDHHAQYCWTYLPANHEVSIIGWDDDYPAENFVKTPTDEEGNPLNGAWLVRNSWGAGDGGQGSIDENGCFWISYYDHTITEFTAFQVDVEEEGLYDYDHNYQYDYLGMKSITPMQPSPELDGRSAVANVFTAEEDERLEAVSAVTVDMNSEVQIEIYKLSEEEVLPDQGELYLEQTEVITYGGYHTIPLDEVVELKAGERFAVIERIHGASGGYTPVEIAYSNEIEVGDKNGSFTNVATVESGESFIGEVTDDTIQWEDCASLRQQALDDPTSEVYNGNVMIKAFTTDLDTPTTVSFKLESFDQEGKSLGVQDLTDLNAEITVPDQTAQIAFWWDVKEGDVEITVNDEVFGEDQAGKQIPIDSKIKIKTTTYPRNNNGLDLILKVSKDQPNPPEPTPTPTPEPTTPKPSPSTPTTTVESTANPTTTVSAVEKGNVGTGLTGQSQGPIVIAVILVVVAVVGLGIFVSYRKRNR